MYVFYLLILHVSLSNRKIIPKDTYVDSRMFAMRGADQVCLFCDHYFFNINKWYTFVSLLIGFEYSNLLFNPSNL